MELKVFEVVVVRGNGQDSLAIVAGPLALVAENEQDAVVKALVDLKLRDSAGIRVLVRPFR